MKVYIRNHSKFFGCQYLMFPYQTVLWLRSEGSEPDGISRRAATRFQKYLIDELHMSYGALGMIQTVQGLLDSDSGAYGILFSRKEYAVEARDALDEWLYDFGNYVRLLQSARKA